MKLSSIDIGTNTILLLIVEIENNNIKLIEDYHKIARLGEGINQFNVIGNEAIQRATDILNFYKSRIEFHKSKVITVATSAMRDAKNGQNVKILFEDLLESEIKIIDGKKEAELSFLGSLVDYDNQSVIDIGGGSTELITGQNKKIEYLNSFQIGAVRLTEMFNLFEKSNENINKTNNYILKIIQEEKIKIYNKLISVAGTPTTLLMMKLGIKIFDRNLIHQNTLKLTEIKNLIDLIVRTDKNELINFYGVHPNRADVILAGGLILYNFMNYTEIEETIVSCDGLRFGIIKEFINKNII